MDQKYALLQPTIKFLLYHSWVFEQADHFSPNDLIEELLSDEAAIVANRSPEFSPAIGANAFVVVNLACARLCRGSRKRLPTFRTADQTLNNTGRDRAPTRAYSVLLEEFLGASKTLFGYQSWHRNLDPLFARAFVTCGAARYRNPPPALWAHNPRPCRDAGLAEAGEAAIGGVALHSPDHRAFPTSSLTDRDTIAVEPPRDVTHAESLDW
ncbi:MAG: hypothetical protein WB660_06500 [Candidatus Sulfotelmatobacter sp.]